MRNKCCEKNDGRLHRQEFEVWIRRKLFNLYFKNSWMLVSHDMSLAGILMTKCTWMYFASSALPTDKPA